jgi:hypothetical protein
MILMLYEIEEDGIDYVTYYGKDFIFDNIINKYKNFELENYSKPLKELPNNIEYLKLHDTYNYSLDELESDTLKELYLCGDFNEPINHLPESLQKLTITGEFNQSLDNLPKYLSYLSLGRCFNQPLNNLPKSLFYLDLVDAENFNYPLDSIPDNLNYLILNENYKYRDQVLQLYPDLLIE